MVVFKVKVMVRKYMNVIYYILGYLKCDLDVKDKVELVVVIIDYYCGFVFLIVLMILFKYYFV